MPNRSERVRQLEAKTVSAEDLVRACVRGEDSAWQSFLDRYGDLIYSVPLKMGVSRSDAEEIFQSTVLGLYERLHTLQDPNRLVAWICEVTRRQTLYYIRKRSRETIEGDDDVMGAIPDPAVRVDDAMTSLEASQYVRDALLDMSPRCRRLLTALYLSDPTPPYAELSRDLDIAIGSIGPTRARCLKALRAGLASRGYVAAAEEDARDGAARK